MSSYTWQKRGKNNNNIMKTRNLLVFLLLFFSLGALFGGGAFLLFPEGWMEMTPELALPQNN